MNKTVRNATFELLLTTAKQLVNEKGCRSTTMQDIMERSGLSKGAIYHYVKSKDELFGLVLQECLEIVNLRFLQAEQEDNKTLEGPLRAIADALYATHIENDVSMRIFIYLLSQLEKPEISRMMNQLYQNIMGVSLEWIKAGQQKGVISTLLDPRKIADLFVTFYYGTQVRYSISPDAAFGPDDFYQFMASVLSNREENKR